MEPKIPVVLIFYKRDIVLNVINKVRKYAPDKIFLISDGGKDEQQNELCKKIRELVENSIDWECNVEKMYYDTNYGCREGITKGLDYVFNRVEQAIILEDDCVPSEKFFIYCQEMLYKYKDYNNIWTISGSNFVAAHNYLHSNKDSYFFSNYPETWGWATWKRAWQKYDKDMKDWVKINKKEFFNSLKLNFFQRFYWSNLFNEIYNKTTNTDPWDGQWVFCQWKNKGITIFPTVNLVKNIGFDENATHTTNNNLLIANCEIQDLKFPLTHPENIEINRKFDRMHGKLVHYNSYRSLFKQYIYSLVNSCKSK